MTLPAALEMYLSSVPGSIPPFCLEEVLRAVAAERCEALPETVVAMVQARLGRLPPGARAVLRAASVFGEVFRKKERFGGARIIQSNFKLLVAVTGWDGGQQVQAGEAVRGPSGRARSSRIIGARLQSAAPGGSSYGGAVDGHHNPQVP
ncbi:hypothetical protein [Sorangium sp. So ce1151]|uniref:hypothetical protein n=1 Tax=Sorangium sp. So ce1151 TaxID=3133332 RepID=UPI003F6016BB